MTEQELYAKIMADDKALEYIEGNNYRRLYNYLMSRRVDYDVEPRELTNLLLGAGIDLFEEGEIFPLAFYEDKGLYDYDFSGVTKIGKLAFKGTSLSSVNLKSVKEIDEGAFFGSKIAELYLGSCEIKESAFGRCPLTELYIPDNNIIRENAFTACDKLETVFLDGSNILVEDLAFSKCKHIENLFITADNLDFIGKVLAHSWGPVNDFNIGIIPTANMPYDEDYIKSFIDANIWAARGKNINITQEKA